MIVGIPELPELTKLRAAARDMDVVRRFLEWLFETRRLCLGTWNRAGEALVPENVNAEMLIQQYFGIDPERVECERRALLAAATKIVQSKADEFGKPSKKERGHQKRC